MLARNLSVKNSAHIGPNPPGYDDFLPVIRILVAVRNDERSGQDPRDRWIGNIRMMHGVHDQLVPETRQDASDGRLAGLTTY